MGGRSRNLPRSTPRAIMLERSLSLSHGASWGGVESGMYAPTLIGVGFGPGFFNWLVQRYHFALLAFAKANACPLEQCVYPWKGCEGGTYRATNISYLCPPRPPGTSLGSVLTPRPSLLGPEPHLIETETPKSRPSSYLGTTSSIDTDAKKITQHRSPQRLSRLLLHRLGRDTEGGWYKSEAFASERQPLE